MAASIPTREPDRITAGDTIKWLRTLSDYPASSGWSLSYAFLPVAGQGVPISVTAAASGSDHLVTISSADSSAFLAGEYNGQAYVTNGSERYLVWIGPLTIDPNFADASSATIDTRSRARRILDFLLGSYEKLAQKQAVQATIEGVQFQFRTLKELDDAINQWQEQVIAEEVAAGTRKPRRAVLAVFTRPG